MKLNQIINLHKGLTPIVVVIMMIYFNNFSTPAWIYLSLHGTYGILWLLKERIFPDLAFKEKINIFTGITGFLFLGLYWVAPYILIANSKIAPNYIISLCIAINIFGVFLHFGSDAQKYFTLKINKQLINDGFFKKNRNTNYLGETLIYFSFALLSYDFIPFIILGMFFILVFLPRMLKKDQSLEKYKSFANYKKNSGLIFPKFYE